MTPFGLRMREMRRERKVTQKEMADSLGVSAAYLSALERGHRGRPNWMLMQKIIGYFNIIWDDAEELVRLGEQSHPRGVIDTAGLSPAATELANLLAAEIGLLDEKDLAELIGLVRSARRR